MDLLMDHLILRGTRKLHALRASVPSLEKAAQGMISRGAHNRLSSDATLQVADYGAIGHTRYAAYC